MRPEPWRILCVFLRTPVANKQKTTLGRPLRFPWECWEREREKSVAGECAVASKWDGNGMKKTEQVCLLLPDLFDGTPKKPGLNSNECHTQSCLRWEKGRQMHCWESPFRVWSQCMKARGADERVMWFHYHWPCSLTLSFWHPMGGTDGHQEKGI